VLKYSAVNFIVPKNMSEGEHTPENKPLTPTEASKRFIENSTYKIKSMGVYALASGVTATLAVTELSNSNYLNAVLSGLASGVCAFNSVNEGFGLHSRISRLSEENAKLKQKEIHNKEV
jgi:hypothetical protein